MLLDLGNPQDWWYSIQSFPSCWLLDPFHPLFDFFFFFDKCITRLVFFGTYFGNTDIGLKNFILHLRRSLCQEYLKITQCKDKWRYQRKGENGNNGQEGMDLSFIHLYYLRLVIGTGVVAAEWRQYVSASTRGGWRAVAGSTEYVNGEGHYNYGIVFWEF